MPCVIQGIEQQCAANGLNIPPLILPGQGDSSPTHSTVSTSTEVTPASTTSTRDPMPTSSASSSSSILTGLHTLSVPPPPSTIVQQTVTVDTRTSAPASTSTPPVSGAAITLRAHVTCVWAIIVIMTIGYLWWRTRQKRRYIHVSFVLCIHTDRVVRSRWKGHIYCMHQARDHVGPDGWT